MTPLTTNSQGFLPSLLLLCLTLPACWNQRTYRRSCDCEYTAAGRCAYTLLLPVPMSGEQSPACPKGGATDHSSRADPPLGGSSAALAERLRLLGADVTDMRENAAEQSWMLNRLQSAMIGVQGRTEALMKQANLTLGEADTITRSGHAGSWEPRPADSSDYEETQRQRQEVEVCLSVSFYVSCCRFLYL